LVMHMDLLFFFFSSRRRHTRSTRDWSSDVCSSDLFRLNEDLLPTVRSRTQMIPKLKEFRRPVRIIFGDADPSLNSGVARTFHERSEERRVGKECRTGWAREPWRDKKTCSCTMSAGI